MIWLAGEHCVWRGVCQVTKKKDDSGSGEKIYIKLQVVYDCKEE